MIVVEKQPKIFTDNKMESFLDSLEGMSKLDVEAAFGMESLEKHYMDRSITFGQPLLGVRVLEKISFFHKSLEARNEVQRKILGTTIRSKEYLTRLVSNSLAIEFVNEENPYEKIELLIRLLVVNVPDEINADYYNRIEKLGESIPPALLNSIPDLLAGILFAKSMLGRVEESQELFDLFEYFPYKGLYSYIYRFLFYFNQKQILEATTDLSIIKKSDESALNRILQLGASHKVITEDDLNQLLQQISS